MDDEEPDHGYGGPAGGGVGFPGVLISGDYDGDDHVAVEGSISQSIFEDYGKDGNSPCSHSDGSDCQDGLTTKLVNIEEGGNCSE